METYLKVSSNAFSYRFVKGVIKALFISLIALSSIGLIIASITNNNFMIIYVFIVSLILQLSWIGVIVFLESQNLGYKLEQHAFLYREGAFSVVKLTIPFVRITNAQFNQTLFQRFFSVGDIAIDQEDGGAWLRGIDSESANKILKEISIKSNIQPILK